jgi:hypothetical protein
MSEWRPIETAPKDGSRVLLWLDCLSECYIGRWQPRGRSPNTWAVAFGSQATSLASGPTHWMPLPAPPESP